MVVSLIKNKAFFIFFDGLLNVSLNMSLSIRLMLTTYRFSTGTEVKLAFGKTLVMVTRACLTTV